MLCTSRRDNSSYIFNKIDTAAFVRVDFGFCQEEGISPHKYQTHWHLAYTPTRHTTIKLVKVKLHFILCAPVQAGI
jgi:hypothetical protein